MMKCVLIVIAVVLISSAYGAPGGKDNKKHGDWVMKCDGTQMKFTEEMKKGHQACFAKHHHGARNKTESTEATTGAPKTKDHKFHHNPNMTCSMVCQFQASGIIGQDGKADKTKMGTFVKTVFPASVQDALVTSYGTCADENGSMATSADGNCDSYKPFVKCIMEANVKACKWTKKEDE